MSERKTGQVKWFNGKKGYGFIVCGDIGDIFVHYADIQGSGFKTLDENETVSFELHKSDKGYKALDVAIEGRS